MKKRFTTVATLAVAVVIMMASHQRAAAQYILLEDTLHTLVQQGIDHIYNLEYAEADKVFAQLKEKAPNNPAAEFLMALNDWWRIKPNILDEGHVKRYSKSYNEHLDNVIEMSEALLEENEFDFVGLFFRGAAYGYKARLKASNDPNVTSVPAWMSILGDANEGRKSLLEGQRLAPSNSDILLGTGLLNYYLDAIPAKFPAVKAISLPPGDKEIGLKMLRISAEKGLYTSVEAKYSLMEILSDWESGRPAKREALSIAKDLHESYPNNPDFYKYYAKNLYNMGKYDEATAEWKVILRNAKAKKAGYQLSTVRQGLYYLGDIQIRQGNPKNAIKLLEEAIKQNEKLDEEGSGYQLASLLRLGNAYDMIGKRKEAIKQYKEILDQDDVNGKYHPKANEYIKTAYTN